MSNDNELGKQGGASRKVGSVVFSATYGKTDFPRKNSL